MNVDHLRGDGYQRLWQRCRASLERSGGAVTGQVSLPDPTEAERHAVGALLRRRLGPRARLVVRLDALDVALRTGSVGAGLMDVIEALTGPLRDRPADAAAARQAIGAVVERARAGLGDDGWVDEWLNGLAADGTLTRLQGEGALDLVGVATAVLARLPADGVNLGVLAATVTGSAKALGPGTLSTLVLRALAVRAGTGFPRSAFARRRLWDGAGVVVDQLSSQVLVLGIGDARDGEPRRWTLRQLRRSGVPGPVGRLWVVENPAVMELAADRLGARCPPLVCTDGQPSTACELVLGTAAEVRVHNDFDWPGLRMGAATIVRHGARPWRMSAADYLAAVRSDLRSLAGRPAPSPWDPALAEAMAETGVGVEEEVVADQLIADLDAAP